MIRSPIIHYNSDLKTAVSNFIDAIYSTMHLHDESNVPSKRFSANRMTFPISSVLDKFLFEGWELPLQSGLPPEDVKKPVI